MWLRGRRRPPGGQGIVIDRPNVLVYQMGKVGSQTVEEGLTQAGIGRVMPTHSHRRAEAAVASCPPGHHLTVITGVREPLARCISAFFQNIRNPRNPWWHYGDPEAVAKADLGDLRAFFDARAPEHARSVLEPWFRRFEETTGVAADALERTEEGCWHAARPDLDVFLYRLEDFGALEGALGRLGRFGRVAFGRRNDAEDKDVADRYRAFRQDYTIPDADYWRDYGSMDWLRPFYSRTELEAMTARYRR